MITKYKIFKSTAFLGIGVVFLLSSFPASANTYLTEGLGFSNVGSFMGSIGVGYKFDDWFRLEADYRTFRRTSEWGATQSVGPLANTNQCSNSSWSLCHDEQVKYDVKTSGNALSAVFTTKNPNAFAYLRVGIMFRADETITYPINVYNSVNSTYTNAGSQTTSSRTAQKIIGIGISGNGFFVEITGYSSYPGLYMDHDFFSTAIGYRLDL